MSEWVSERVNEGVTTGLTQEQGKKETATTGYSVESKASQIATISNQRSNKHLGINT